jgi:hypothetical protein
MPIKRSYSVADTSREKLVTNSSKSPPLVLSLTFEYHEDMNANGKEKVKVQVTFEHCEKAAIGNRGNRLHLCWF